MVLQYTNTESPYTVPVLLSIPLSQVSLLTGLLLLVLWVIHNNYDSTSFLFFSFLTINNLGDLSGKLLLFFLGG